MTRSTTSIVLAFASFCTRIVTPGFPLIRTISVCSWKLSSTEPTSLMLTGTPLTTLTTMSSIGFTTLNWLSVFSE